MSSLPNTPKRSGFWLRKLIFHPMLLISVLLHGAVLSIPLLPSKQAPEPPKKKEEERISLTALLPPSSVAASKPAASAAPKSKTAAPAAAPSAVAAAPAAPVPAPAAPVTPTAAPPPSVDLGVSGSIGLCPNPQSFDAQQIGYFFTDPSNPDSSPAAGIVKIDWKNTPPAQVQSDLRALAVAQKLVLQPMNDFGGSPLFALQTAEGQTALYASLVAGKGAASTMLVTWSGDPNALPAGTAALSRAQVCQ